jgi:hypothetical protein
MGRPTFRTLVAVNRATLLVLITGVVLGWPVEIAILLTAIMAIATSLSPGRPERPSRTHSLPVNLAIIACGSVVFLAMGWHLVALFFADDSRDLAAPVATFAVSFYLLKSYLWWDRRSATSAATSDDS